jgi:rubrerythrin
MSRDMEAERKNDPNDAADNVWMNCPTCEEEYQFPEGLKRCPICGKKGLEEI